MAFLTFPLRSLDLDLPTTLATLDPLKHSVRKLQHASRHLKEIERLLRNGTSEVAVVGRVFERHLKEFALHVLDRERERHLLHRVSVLFMAICTGC
ncbi:hypothetical protein BCR33DRAFT_786131 [Rhizoclosmatium globosum]|uniref:Uncharacterized protein n=1 Tax=Rhizoclosmatium globosum TaxID=329046 RepID=A0A1Y2C7F4_9FUNG|nr:hypothetical protein BCR33DRAFT_786131 [Rhizoclosmatium globosum]|eukprot:ORY42837.1 hypothetical protein BCR33DRAFT_786131 [Rhizoclosmatium globosum]